MPAPLVPARLALKADGTPFSTEYDDVYHSGGGGIGQAQYVFLRGNGLPERWRGRRSFTILETGFGFGLNFLSTWSAWRDDPGRCERLHFVSIEKHPFELSDSKILWEKTPEIEKQAFALAACWPLLVPGMHRIELEGGNVVLTLFFVDVAIGLPQLSLDADAIFLDGFAPAKNPQMWEPRLLRHLGRLAAPGCTLATWSVATAVRGALEDAGFAVEKAPGFGSKREMLVGRSVRRRFRGVSSIENRKAVVIGAGVAGAAVCERLAARGWKVTLIERHAGPAMEASGNHAAAFHPIVSPDDSLLARLTRASFLFLLNCWKHLPDEDWQRCGVLQLARDDAERDSQRRALQTLGYPPEYAQFDAARGGIWFPEAGWVRPRRLVKALLLRCGNFLEEKYLTEVEALKFSDGHWTCFDKNEVPIAKAATVVLANAADALRLAPRPEVRLRQVRGQLTLVPAIAGLDHVLLRGGMALPGIDGQSLVGASFDIDDADPQLRADSHAGNLARLERMLPGASAGFNPDLDPGKLDGRVAFRAVVRDRMPIVGLLGPGLYGAFAYGSRGMLWASLAGELIASQIEGEPLPVERSLAAAVAPERFLLREKKKPPTAAPA